jgi:uncharacterized protein (TIGR04255 family)
VTYGLGKDALQNCYGAHLPARECMRIFKADNRVLYQNNPLVEVICQARFRRSEILTPPEGFLTDLATAGYSKTFSLAPINIQVNVAGQGAGGIEHHIAVPAPEVGGLHSFNCTTEDDNWTVSFNAENLSLSCKNYTTWSEFRPRFIEAQKLYGKWYPQSKAVRLGLRYKDVIDREKLGLVQKQWHSLIQPFLLGALSVGVFADGETIPESRVSGCLTQAIVALDDCSLTLQTALLRAVSDQSKTAFLIDSDFSKNSEEILDLAYSDDILNSSLEALHENAGAMFRRVITEELHGALGPIS